MEELARGAKPSSMLLKELAGTGVHLPEIGFGTWNYARGVEPLRDPPSYLANSQGLLLPHFDGQIIGSAQLLLQGLASSAETARGR